MFKKHGYKAQPHGKEWKSLYQEILLLAIKEQLFEDKFLEFVLHYLAKPKATIDLATLNRLTNQTEGVLLCDLKEGISFNFHGKSFKKVKNRRTRVLCQRQDNQKLYTISRLAEIELLN